MFLSQMQNNLKITYSTSALKGLKVLQSRLNREQVRKSKLPGWSCTGAQYYSRAVSPYGTFNLVQTVWCGLDGSSTDRSFLLAMPKRPHTNRVESNCVECVLLRARCVFRRTEGGRRTVRRS